MVISFAWMVWAISWMAAAWWSNRTESRPASREEARYRVLTVIGVIMMTAPAHGYEGSLRLWHVSWMVGWLCAVVVIAGIAIAWWARLYLGRLWSARVTKKADHQVVESGPYAFVRHPIYTGLLLSLLATAIAKGTMLGVGGFIVLVIGTYFKARLEERWLATELDVDAYNRYRQRVPMLLPFWPTSSKDK
jgi:protein-S-isoprenylcysteine O-methyltransferase Ste14